jgi:hypothetical protein
MGHSVCTGAHVACWLPGALALHMCSAAAARAPLTSVPACPQLPCAASRAGLLRWLVLWRAFLMMPSKKECDAQVQSPDGKKKCCAAQEQSPCSGVLVDLQASTDLSGRTPGCRAGRAVISSVPSVAEGQTACCHECNKKYTKQTLQYTLKLCARNNCHVHRFSSHCRRQHTAAMPPAAAAAATNNQPMLLLLRPAQPLQHLG